MNAGPATVTYTHGAVQYALGKVATPQRSVVRRTESEWAATSSSDLRQFAAVDHLVECNSSSSSSTGTGTDTDANTTGDKERTIIHTTYSIQYSTVQCSAVQIVQHSTDQTVQC